MYHGAVLGHSRASGLWHIPIGSLHEPLQAYKFHCFHGLPAILGKRFAGYHVRKFTEIVFRLVPLTNHSAQVLFLRAVPVSAL